MAFAILRRILPTTPAAPKAETQAPMQTKAPMPPVAPSPAPSTPTDAHSSATSAAAPSASSATTADCEPPEEVRELRTVCAELDQAVTRFLEEHVEDEVLRGVQGRVRESMGVIAEALERYTPDQLSLSYNGGKDCLVLLILLLATLNRHPPSPFPRTLHSIYIVPPHPFPEVDAFVAHTSNAYSLTLTRSPLPMRAALSSHLSSTPSLKAVFVGTRRTDPHGSLLSSFDETDGDWPRFMRVHPVLEWHYAEIWAFIRHLRLEYCRLYDQGYTSLGGTDDTLRNPALRGEGGFRPAYELVSDGEERLGRE